MPRPQQGSSLIELPLGIWLALLFFLFPFICYATLAYRAGFFYFAVKDACNHASRAASFTQAQTTASTVFSHDVSSFTGIQNAVVQVFAVEQPLPHSGATVVAQPTQISSNPLPQVITATNSYFIQVTGNATIQPLISFGANGWMGLNIPGLTGPYSLSVSCKNYAEVPQGLLQ